MQNYVFQQFMSNFYRFMIGHKFAIFNETLILKIVFAFNQSLYLYHINYNFKTMKINRLLILSALVTLSFTACKDSKKEQAEKEKMEMEAMQAEEMKMAEEKKMADEKARMEFEENSVAGVAMKSADHTTLVAAVKAADLAVMLKGEGPYTVFAPTNAAFDALPKGTVEELLKPENKEKLQAVLSYHVIPGDVDSAKLTELIKANNGFYMLQTANGGELRAEINKAGNIILTDGRGKQSTIVQADLKASNGYVHVINTVVMRG